MGQKASMREGLWQTIRQPTYGWDLGMGKRAPLEWAGYGNLVLRGR
jgi:hypothetical protein